MAKIVSPIISIGSGSLAGITMTRNRYSNLIFRQKVTPVNPSSQNQGRVRNSFATAVNAWRNATQDVRDGWDNYARSLTYQSPTGEYSPTGRDAFMGAYTDALYLNVRGMSITPGTAAPVIPGALTIDNLDMTPGVALETGVKVSGSNLGNEDFILYATLSTGYDPSRNYPPSSFLSAKLDEVALSSPGSGQIDFPDLVAGLRYFARIRAISDAEPHRISGLFFLSAIAEDPA